MTMRYKQLGKWGLRVSALGFGTHMNLGDQCDEATSREMVRVAYDAGLNFFDTANAYAAGEAERALGRCIADYPRSDFVISTKVAGRMGQGPNDAGLSAKHIREQCDASLRRLGLDYVDIYLCHAFDPDTPIEETVRAMDDLIRSGKVLYWGVSNWPAEMIVRANALAREIGARPMAANEPRYSLVYRYPESLMFPTTRAEGMGNFTFSPLGHGLLAGIYKPGETPPPGSRAAIDGNNPANRKLYMREDLIAKSQEFVGMAGDMGVSAAELAIAWCMNNNDVTSCIMGAWTVKELRQNLKAVELEITQDVKTRLETLFPTPEITPTL